MAVSRDTDFLDTWHHPICLRDATAARWPEERERDTRTTRKLFVKRAPDVLRWALLTALKKKQAKGFEGLPAAGVAAAACTFKQAQARGKRAPRLDDSLAHREPRFSHSKYGIRDGLSRSFSPTMFFDYFIIHTHSISWTRLYCTGKKKYHPDDLCLGFFGTRGGRESWEGSMYLWLAGFLGRTGW